MDINTFTQRSQQAILGARDAAATRTHQYVQPVHLLDALLAQTDGTTRPLLAAVGVDAEQLIREADALAAKLPSASGPSVAATRMQVAASGPVISWSEEPNSA